MLSWMQPLKGYVVPLLQICYLSFASVILKRPLHLRMLATKHCSHPRVVTSRLNCASCAMQILDLMGYEPSPENKVNIHIGGIYGELQSHHQLCILERGGQCCLSVLLSIS